MKWIYRHAKHGTCVPGCPLYGMCHCQCGGKTTMAIVKNRRDYIVEQGPYVFLNHHHKPSQWRDRRMATCHIDRPAHAQGLCKSCYWSKHKRANNRKHRVAVNDWERARFTRFLVLTRGGFGRDEAMRQLERDVPSEFPEMETG